MATIPNKIEKITSVESDEFSSVAVASWAKAAAALEYLNRSFPIGMLLFMDNTMDLVPATPDPKYWQFCDGSPVVNMHSPMYGQNVPDCRNKFIKHPETGQPALVTGGSDTVSIPHDHGGTTGVGNDADALRLSSGGERGFAIGTHTHHIYPQTIAANIVPLNRQLQVYMRVV